MGANRSTDTLPEVALRRELHRRGLRFRKHFAPVAGLRCRPDVVFTRAKVAVFMDGCFWHGCPLHGTTPKTNRDWWTSKLETNTQRDQRQNDALRAAGWTVVRCWEHEAIHEAATRVEATVIAAREALTKCPSPAGDAT